MTEDNFLTTEEVLSYLQINLRTIYRLIRAGKLPAFRVGRQWRFRRDDIEAWLAGRQAAVRRPHDKARILIVDDEPAVRAMLERALSDADYEVAAVGDGPAALDRLREADYDLLIIDLKMPGMDGLSVVRAVRRRSLGLPVIVITGFSTEASAIEAINLGVSGYLTKPFRVPRIISVTKRALGVQVRSVHV
jgi:excisionase family DNA binding protein